MTRAFSTIELLIAMTIMVLVLAAVIIVSFGNQSSLIGSQTSSEALKKAQGLLETAQALARKDFNLVNATSSFDGFYTSTVEVTNGGTSGNPDYFTKHVKAVITWKDERGANRTFDMSTLVSNFTGSSGETCNSAPQGDWRSPVTHAYSVTGLAGVAGGYPITALDAYLNRLYVAASPTTLASDTTFFVFNLASGVPSYIGGSGVDTSGAASTKGPNALVITDAVAQNGKTYAFLANGASPNWNTCDLGPGCSQLQVVDVTNPAVPSTILNFKFATSSESVPWYSPPFVNGNGGQAVGKSIAYRNGYVFLGLSKTGAGPEFHIIDVRALDMANPLSLQPVGSYTVGATVNAIRVRGNYAYLAVTGSTQLVVLDISDPLHPTPVIGSVYEPPGQNGESLAVVGDTLYFGQAYQVSSTTPEFFEFDISHVSNTTTAIPAPNPLSSGTFKAYASVYGILVRDFLAFMTTSPTGEIIIRNATSTAQYAPPIALPAAGTALDCEGNYLYVGSSDGAGSITTVTAN
jgi:type II secretory pathway pseudopilin PulG